MALEYGKVGITLIGPPGSGKSTLAKLIVKELSQYRYHDHDDDGLEPALRAMGYGSIADAIERMGDKAFLDFEGSYTSQNYGKKSENKQFVLDDTIFASSGSIVRSAASIEYIRARTHILFLDIPYPIVFHQIQHRSGGSGRIIGMHGGPHGEVPMSKNLKAELLFRDSLYRNYQDSILEHRPRETPETTAMRLLKHIQDILRNS